MATLVGTQESFKKAVQELVELEYDAVEAYEAAINRTENEKYKKHFQEFKSDHEKHIKALNEALEKHEMGTVAGPSAKQWLTKGKVVLANLVGDEAILGAMISNEEDTNKAYENINKHEDKWADVEDLLKQGLKDEQKHKKWLEDNRKDV